MDKLRPDWITEGLIDLEYKKYILLGYLKHVSSRFSDGRLYPFLTDLIFHYKNVAQLKENKRIVSEQFPKRLSRIDLEEFRLEYEMMMHDSSFMAEIESILDFAIPKLKQGVDDGTGFYDMVEEQLNISPVGIVPLTTEHGYLLFYIDNKPDTRVFSYQITIFENAEERYRGIRTEYLQSYQRSISTTFEYMKLDLIRQQSIRSAPAAFLVHSRLDFPLEDTLLPVAKRSFVRYLAGNGI